ncbi:zinc chelation protein SecC [Naasia lichenicola]|uniref:Zinc chelation protein SecC n=1 Tax=Naasia lichenicola TaxID=2565933 RepID=A0A4S4FTC0_9MICO|nr:zinc chelation protein SecC [Naasia lichenicola]
MLCPCGSKADYADCCGPIQHGTPAPTALALMRSRFTAFTLELAGHLLRTWHPDTRPKRIDFDEGFLWRRLQIVDTVRGGVDDTEGIVEFRAIYSGPQGTGFIHERGRFVRVDGEWLYLDGTVYDS